MNLQEVAGGKKFLELLLEVVKFYRLPPDKDNTDRDDFLMHKTLAIFIY